MIAINFFFGFKQREAKAKVQNMLEKLGQQLEDMKTRVLDMNDYHQNALQPNFDDLIDEEVEARI